MTPAIDLDLGLNPIEQGAAMAGAVTFTGRVGLQPAASGLSGRTAIGRWPDAADTADTSSVA